jgi:acetylcholinesterase
METWAAAGLDAYSYRFNAIPNGLSYFSGVTHFQEVSFVFYNLLGEGYGIYPTVSRKPFLNKPQSYADLAYLMSCSWVSFIHDLNPNDWNTRPANVTAWPKYSLSNPQNMVWDANVTSHAEPDTFRAEGIKLINDYAASVYQR